MLFAGDEPKPPYPPLLDDPYALEDDSNAFAVGAGAAGGAAGAAVGCDIPPAPHTLATLRVLSLNESS